MNFLSFSQVNMYSRCGLQYYFRYIEGRKVPPASALILGSAVHKGQETEYRHKMEKGEDLALDSVSDIVADEIERAFSEDVLLNEEEQSRGKDLVKGEVKDTGVSMIATYYNEVAVRTTPVAVEEKFEFGVGVGVPVIGYIDLITDDGVVVDTKTTSKAPTKDQAEKSQQLTIYALGYQTLYGFLPESLRLDFVVAPGKKTPSRVIALETTRSEEQIARFARRVARVVDGIRKGVFIPPDQGSWACSYCGYRDTGICKEYLI